MKKTKNRKEENWKKWKVPYRLNGSVDWRMPNKNAEYFHSYYGNANKPREQDRIVWKPNKPFRAALKFVSMFHGANASTHAIFGNTETDATYVMRNSDLEFCLKNGVLIYGLILGKWRFKRDGGRMSIVPVELLSTNDFKK